MCLYCGCSVILNRKPENEARYVDYLMREIDLVTEHFDKRAVTQLHFGGGTPTKLSIPLFQKLYEKIASTFEISGEVAIEIDPRTVTEDRGRKLRFLKELGFNRVSFGVQDTNWQVQEAVKRRQSLEMTEKTYAWARELQFDGVNIDLIYGLPYQTAQTFKETVRHILAMRPDRISLFSYAKVPWLKKHQLAIKDETLPSTEEKFQIYQEARQAFVTAGYIAIGMDHFALPTDEMALCYKEKRLQRNFQGYSAKLAKDQLGFGTTAIGFVQNCYAQNIKTLPEYYAAIDQNELPVCRGMELSQQDIECKWLIHTLMSNFCLDKREYERLFGKRYRFEIKECQEFVTETEDFVQVTAEGELFIRNIAMNFDAYLQTSEKPQYSQSI
ncbi:MAG: Oxygen-independent coproporphyrinogen III oxidase [Chlamydiales bacterium]|nr:Oxygen-independent coproporphyrinogen III oxidase [Chlamydiales bacterium]MCH9635362.1 Oxygen-independent coproporphyrinogen III oxidase [Chlamydiales bacterium]